MAKTKTTFQQYEVGQTVVLTRAILRYSDARAGIEFNPPQVLFAEGTKATVLERKPNSDSYLIVMEDSSFVISRHAASLAALPEADEVALLPAGDAGMFPAAHPRPCVPAVIADNYDDAAEFQQDVEKFWSLDECLEYPCAVTLNHAYSLLRDIAWNDGYDGLLPAYERFVAVCQDDVLLMDVDKLLQDYQPGSDRDNRYYGQVRR